MSTTNPTESDLGKNQGRIVEKPTINRLSYDKTRQATQLNPS
jgi:hypothetical protein